MLGYSPYDNTTARDYPAVYITAGLNDPRVSYHEPAKWCAKLRAVAHQRRAAGDEDRDGRRPRRPERSLRPLARRGPRPRVQHRRRRLTRGGPPAPPGRAQFPAQSVRFPGRTAPVARRTAPGTEAAVAGRGWRRRASGQAMITAIARTANTAFRATCPQPIGRALHAPKHAHGGRRPCRSRITSSAVNATSATSATAAAARRASCTASHAPTASSNHGSTRAIARGAPRSAACCSHVRPAAILLAPASDEHRAEHDRQHHRHAGRLRADLARSPVSFS